MRERLLHLLESLGLTKKIFAGRIGLSPSTISDYLNGRLKSISADAIAAIYKEFNVNPIWLLTGEGEMFLSDSTGSAQRSAPLGDRDTGPSHQGDEKEKKKNSRSYNHLSAHDGGVKEYPEIITIEQVYLTQWYQNLDDDAQFIVNGLDELRDEETLKTIKKIISAGIVLQRAKDDAARMVDDLGEDAPAFRKKGEAG